MKKSAYTFVFALLLIAFSGCNPDSGDIPPPDITEQTESEISDTPPVILEGNLIRTDHFTIEVNESWEVNDEDTNRVTVDLSLDTHRGNITIMANCRTQITSFHNLPADADIESIYNAMPRSLESPEDGSLMTFRVELIELNGHRAISVQSLDPDTGSPLAELSFSYLIVDDIHVYNIAGFATDGEILSDLHSILQTFSLTAR
jgi:hypothetical protein